MSPESMLIAHPDSKEQLIALKAFVKALKIKFEVKVYETPYDETFVDMVLQGEKEIKKGNGLKITSEEFDNLWK